MTNIDEKIKELEKQKSKIKIDSEQESLDLLAVPYFEQFKKVDNMKKQIKILDEQIDLLNKAKELIEK